MNRFFLYYQGGGCTWGDHSCDLQGFATLAEAEEARDDYLKANASLDPEVVIIEGKVVYERVLGS